MITETVEITPTWEDILPLLLVAYAHGSFEGKRAANEELTRMALLADLYVNSIKQKGEK